MTRHRRLASLGLPVIAALVLATPPAAAHKAHRAAAAAETSRAEGRVGAVRDSVRDTTANVLRSADEVFAMPPFRQAALEHLHNKIVHFPIALALTAGVLLLIARRRRDLERVAHWLVWGAALGGAASWLTGRAQQRAFDGEPMEWVARLHGNWGTATAIGLGVWAVLTLWAPARRLAPWIGLATMALVAIASYLGGIVAHGE